MLICLQQLYWFWWLQGNCTSGDNCLVRLSLPFKITLLHGDGRFGGSHNTTAFAFLQTEAVAVERTEEGSEGETLKGRDTEIYVLFWIVKALKQPCLSPVIMKEKKTIFFPWRNNLIWITTRRYQKCHFGARWGCFFECSNLNSYFAKLIIMWICSVQFKDKWNTFKYFIY